MMNTKKIKVNLLTYFFIFLLLYSGYKQYLFVYLIVFITHELGHILFLKIFNIKINKIEIYPFGGSIKLEKKLNIEIYKDFLITSGGFIFQILLEIINILFIKYSLISYINKWLFYINILPLVPLDGSKLLFIIMSKYISYFKSIKLYGFFSIVFIIIYSLKTISNHNSNSIFITFCIMSLLKELSNEKYILNKFYLERYLLNLNYKKNKYHQNNNYKLIKREEHSFFFDKYWKNEKEILSKKFDNSSIFW